MNKNTVSHKTKTECPECKETFKGSVGRATHMRRAHSLNVDGTPYVQPASKPTAIVVVKRKKKEDHASQIVADHEPTEHYAYVAAHLESIIHRVALEHDFVEKRFAQGFFRYIHRS